MEETKYEEQTNQLLLFCIGLYLRPLKLFCLHTKIHAFQLIFYLQFCIAFISKPNYYQNYNYFYVKALF